MHWLPQINKDSSPQEIESAMRVCGEKLSYGNIPEMERLLEYMTPIIKEGNHLPYHKIIKCTLYYLTGKIKQSEKISKKLSRVNWMSDDIKGWHAVLRGSNLRSLGKFDKAIKYLELGYKLIPPKSKLNVFLTFSLYQLGHIYILFEDYKEAEEKFIEGYKMAEKIGNSRAYYRLALGMGSFYVKIYQLEKAKEFLNEALDLADYDRALRANVYYEMANFYFAQNTNDVALDMCNKAIRLRREENLQDALTTANILKVRILLKNNECVNAIALCTGTLKKVREFKTQIKERDCLELLAEAHEKLNNHKDALLYLRGYNNLQFNIINKQYRNILKEKNKYNFKQKKQY